MSDDGPPRDVLARALMTTATEDNELADHLLTGFVVIAEWMEPDGDRTLTLTGGTGEGEPIPEWTVQGFLTNALAPMAPWTFGRPDDEDGDG